MPLTSATLGAGDGRSEAPCTSAGENRPEANGSPPRPDPAPQPEATPDGGTPSAADGTRPQAAPHAHPFRYYVKGAKGDFGVVDMVQLQQLYHSGFLTRDNLVRRDGTDIYRKAGCIPELQVAEEKPWLEGNEVIVLAVLLCVATLLMILVLRW